MIMKKPARKFIMGVLCVLTFAAASFAAPKSGLATVGRTSTPPAIDGKLNDKCWEQCIEVSPFVLMSQGKFAKEQTRVRLCYDKENFYLAFHNAESCLNPVNNQLHAFKQDVRANDDNYIFTDDCIAILLDTNRDKNTFFDLFINANGMINDARCGGVSPSKTWQTRDKTWNSKARVAVGIENGYWVVEVAIPFSSLNTVPKPKDSWRVCFGRIQKSQAETSTWQPMKVGFHDAQEFGRIVFGKATPGARAMQFGPFKVGKNQWRAEVDAGTPDTQLQLELSVAIDKKRPKKAFHNFTVSGKKQVSGDYVLAKGGDISFRFTLKNANTYETYYRSPLYSDSIVSSALKISAAVGKISKFHVNGAEISNEAALVDGENGIAIKTDRPAEMKFTVGDFTFTLDNTWKYSAAAEDGWQQKDFDDSQWTRAASENGSVTGKGYYRKTLLLNTSRFWPNWKSKGISIAQDSIQQLFLVPEGLKGRTLKNYSLYLETPEEFEVLGASGYYKILPVSCVKTGVISRNQKKYSQYRISIRKPLGFRDIFRSHLFISIPVHLRVLEKKSASDSAVFYYYMKAEDGYLEEAPQALKVNILPPLKGKQPKKYAWQLGCAWLGRMDNADLKYRVLELMDKSGINEVWYSKLIPGHIKLRSLVGISFSSWGFNCVPYLAKHPDHALLDNTGQRRYIPGNARKNQICTSLLLQDSQAWDYLEKLVMEWVKKRDVDNLHWDYEAPVWKSAISCYCPLCMKKFREFAKNIPADAELTAKTIKKNHRADWIRFMNMRMALMCGKFRDAARKAKPDIVFSVYSGYQCDHTKAHYGVDWAMLRDRIDMAICGYGRNEKTLADTLKALGSTPLVLGELVYPYDVKKQEYPAFASKAILLRRAVDGTGGIMIWTMTQLDGRTFYASAEISRLVADYEDLFLANQQKNSLVKVTGISADNVVVLTKGKTRLILLLNESKTGKKVKLRYQEPARKIAVHDYYGAKDLGNTREITTEIPPNDVKVFVVTIME